MKSRITFLFFTVLFSTFAHAESFQFELQLQTFECVQGEQGICTQTPSDPAVQEVITIELKNEGCSDGNNGNCDGPSVAYGHFEKLYSSKEYKIFQDVLAEVGIYRIINPNGTEYSVMAKSTPVNDLPDQARVASVTANDLTKISRFGVQGAKQIFILPDGRRDIIQTDMHISKMKILDNK